MHIGYFTRGVNIIVGYVKIAFAFKKMLLSHYRSRILEGPISITKHPVCGGLCVSKLRATHTFTHCLSLNAVAYWGTWSRAFCVSDWRGGGGRLQWWHGTAGDLQGEEATAWICFHCRICSKVSTSYKSRVHLWVRRGLRIRDRITYMNKTLTLFWCQLFTSIWLFMMHLWVLHVSYWEH